MTPLIDTHCHLDAERFESDREAVLQRAWEAGVTGIIVPGIGPGNWEPLLQWPTRDARLQVGLGIHPQLLPQQPESDDAAAIELLDSLLSRGGAIAVGECGLDGPSIQAGASLERQVRVLREHFRLARRYGLPVLLHCYRTHPALVELLKTEPFPEAGVLLHSYSGGADLARFYAKAGCHFSLAGPISFLEARKPLDSLRAIPLDRLMLETDAPDQAPHPHRGQRCEPGYVRLVAQAAARVLGMDEIDLAERTTATARAFFRQPFPAG